ncbi:MAG: beta-ketoacyl-[acyl-carrier-protein] synthase family protein [Acidobacteriota bacterium]
MGAREQASVVVTGIGLVTAIGNGVGSVWPAAIAGKSGTRLVDFAWTKERAFKCQTGAPVSPPAPQEYGCNAEELKYIDPTGQFALAACHMALRDAGLTLARVEDKREIYRLNEVDERRIGTVIGTAVGGMPTIEWSHQHWLSGRPITGTLRFSLPMLIPNAIPGQLAIKFGLRGENKSITTACAAGTMALGDAFRLIRSGALDAVVAGGAECLLSDNDGFGMIGFELLRTLSSRNHDPAGASRPFDAERDGFVMGEGAGLLVLERRDHAVARGARIYCEVAGYAANSDAYSMVQLDPSGEQITDVLSQALADADLGLGDIGYVNAHGTATRVNDAVEAKAMRRLWGRQIDDVLVNSTKAMIGHTIGAAGGIEAAITALSLYHEQVHPCVNLETPDPECDLNLPRRATQLTGRAAMSNSYGFGGHNASIVLKPQ